MKSICHKEERTQVKGFMTYSNCVGLGLEMVHGTGLAQQQTMSLSQTSVNISASHIRTNWSLSQSPSHSAWVCHHLALKPWSGKTKPEVQKRRYGCPHKYSYSPKTFKGKRNSSISEIFHNFYQLNETLQEVNCVAHNTLDFSERRKLWFCYQCPLNMYHYVTDPLVQTEFILKNSQFVLREKIHLMEKNHCSDDYCENEWIITRSLKDHISLIHGLNCYFIQIHIYMGLDSYL